MPNKKKKQQSYKQMMAAILKPNTKDVQSKTKPVVLGGGVPEKVIKI
jgi:hypothetical protein